MAREEQRHVLADRDLAIREQFDQERRSRASSGASTATAGAAARRERRSGSRPGQRAGGVCAVSRRCPCRFGDDVVEVEQRLGAGAVRVVDDGGAGGTELRRHQVGGEVGAAITGAPLRAAKTRARCVLAAAAGSMTVSAGARPARPAIEPLDAC